MLLSPISEKGDNQKIFEGLSIQLSPAPVYLRVLCFLIDVGVISAILYPLLFIGLVLFGFVGAGASTLFSEEVGALIIIIFIGIFLLGFLLVNSLYFIYFERKSGQTPGKKLFGLQVISFDQQTLSIQQVILRELARIVDVMLLVPGIFTMIITEKNQRLGDLLAGTMVVRSRSEEEKSQSHYLNSEEFYAMLETLKPTRFEPEVEKSFLQFCFNHFTLGAHDKTNQYLADWIKAVNFQFKNQPADKYPPITLLRFYAEFALKSVNSQ